MPEIYVEPICKEHISLIKDFCTVENASDLDYFKNYLMYNGLLDNEEGMAKTKLYISEDEKVIGKPLLCQWQQPFCSVYY